MLAAAHGAEPLHRAPGHHQGDPRHRPARPRPGGRGRRVRRPVSWRNRAKRWINLHGPPRAPSLATSPIALEEPPREAPSNDATNCHDCGCSRSRDRIWRNLGLGGNLVHHLQHDRRCVQWLWVHFLSDKDEREYARRPPVVERRGSYQVSARTNSPFGTGTWTGYVVDDGTNHSLQNSLASGSNVRAQFRNRPQTPVQVQVDGQWRSN